MSTTTGTWVIYKTTLPNHEKPLNAICPERDWDTIRQTRPGAHTLIRDGLRSEGEAERLARSLTGDATERPSDPFAKRMEFYRR